MALNQVPPASTSPVLRATYNNSGTYTAASYPQVISVLAIGGGGNGGAGGLGAQRWINGQGNGRSAGAGGGGG